MMNKKRLPTIAILLFALFTATPTLAVADDKKPPTKVEKAKAAVKEVAKKVLEKAADAAAGSAGAPTH